MTLVFIETPYRKNRDHSMIYTGTVERLMFSIFAHRMDLISFFFAKIARSVRCHTLAEYACCTFTTNLPQIQLASIRFLCRSNCA